MKQMKIGLTILLLLALASCASDPEFLNCYIEIITETDTLTLTGALVEFEGSTLNGGDNAVNDNVLIIKNGIEYNFPERLIKKMTIIYEAQ